MKDFYSVNILLMILILPFQQHVLANPLPLDTESIECASYNGTCLPSSPFYLSFERGTIPNDSL